MPLIRYFPSLVLAGTCLLAVLHHAGAADEQTTTTTPLPGEALKLGEILRSETTKIVQQYKEALKALPSSHQAKLAALQKKLQQEDGDLEGYLQTGNEIKRFNEALKAEPDPFELIPEMPATALVEKPAALRALQDQYIKDYNDQSGIRDKRVDDLVRRYIAQMEKQKTDLTIKGRIPEAVAVKNEIERIRASLEDKTLLLQIMPTTTTSKTPTVPVIKTTDSNTTPESLVYGKTPEWAKWQFDRTGNITADNFLFAHPDIPDELSIDFLSKTGRGRIYGRCEVERRAVDMRECTWFGKAIQWKVSDFATLNATIILQSKDIAAGQGYGPKAFLLLLDDKGPLGEALEVTMTAKEATLTIAKDPEVNNCTLGWVQGKIKKTMSLPTTPGTVRVLFGISVRNAGERCDTSINLQ